MIKNNDFFFINNLLTKFRNQSNSNHYQNEITKEKKYFKSVKVLDTAQRHYAT